MVINFRCEMDNMQKTKGKVSCCQALRVAQLKKSSTFRCHRKEVERSMFSTTTQ